MLNGSWKSCGRLAQLVERQPYKLNVVGSIPAAPTTFFSSIRFCPQEDESSSERMLLEHAAPSPALVASGRGHAFWLSFNELVFELIARTRYCRANAKIPRIE